MEQFTNSQIVIVPADSWHILREWFLKQDFEIGEGIPLGLTILGPVTHRLFHSWMVDSLIVKANIEGPKPWQNDTIVDIGVQSNKQDRYTFIKGSLVAVSVDIVNLKDTK